MTPFPDGRIGKVAEAFTYLVEHRYLPRFAAFRLGAGNCHGIVRQLRMDLQAEQAGDTCLRSRAAAAEF